MDAIALVPMHPHTLSSRPIVVGGQSEIKIVIRENRVLPMVSADGQHSVSLNVGDSLHIRKHPFKLSLLHPQVMISIGLSYQTGLEPRF